MILNKFPVCFGDLTICFIVLPSCFCATKKFNNPEGNAAIIDLVSRKNINPVKTIMEAINEKTLAAELFIITIPAEIMVPDPVIIADFDIFLNGLLKKTKSSSIRQNIKMFTPKSCFQNK